VNTGKFFSGKELRERHRPTSTTRRETPLRDIPGIPKKKLVTPPFFGEIGNRGRPSVVQAGVASLNQSQRTR